MALNVIGQNWSYKPECNGGLGLGTRPFIAVEGTRVNSIKVVFTF